MFDITVIGDVTQDRFLILDDQDARINCRKKNLECELCFDYGKKIPINRIAELIGGNAANVAVAFSRLGLDTAIVSTLSRDKSGLAILQALKNAHINVTNIERKTSGGSNSSTIIVFKGERTILTHHEKINYQITDISESRWLYLTSMGKNSEKIYGKILKKIDEMSAKLIFQPGSYQLRFGLKTLKPILERTYIFIANLAEYQELLNLKDEKLSSINYMKIKEIIASMIKTGPKIVVLTNGLDGVYLLKDENFYHINAWSDRNLVDQTGAGDAFASAFCAAIILNKSCEEALQWGIANSGNIIESIGAQTGLLSQAEISYLIKNQKIPIAKNY